MRRILGGEGGPQEVEAAAEHLIACDLCRAVADHLRSETPELAASGPLRLAFELIDRERQSAVDYRPRSRSGPSCGACRTGAARGTG